LRQKAAIVLDSYVRSSGITGGTKEIKIKIRIKIGNRRTAEKSERHPLKREEKNFAGRVFVV
jgi:hypothetical protein